MSMETQEQNSHTYERFDCAHHSDKTEHKEEEILQKAIKIPTAPRKELEEGDINLT